MNPYGCIATGDEEGMIEIVLNADTTANITKAYGGAMAAYKKETISTWLREHNPSPAEYEQAQDNFARSCAGYCVATYVLGIGDRHNDNVMITKNGQLFRCVLERIDRSTCAPLSQCCHLPSVDIDFGHFLGNIKRKFGIKRERAPFVFTPDFAHVLDGRDSPAFRKFVDYSCQAYEILRENGSMFINLFFLVCLHILFNPAASMG